MEEKITTSKLIINNQSFIFNTIKWNFSDWPIVVKIPYLQNFLIKTKSNSTPI